MSKEQTTIFKVTFWTKAMWLTHTYFAVYLFSDFIHAPRYPLLIFLLLVVVTWFSAFPLERISQFICSFILPKCKKQLLL